MITSTSPSESVLYGVVSQPGNRLEEVDIQEFLERTFPMIEKGQIEEVMEQVSSSTRDLRPDEVEELRAYENLCRREAVVSLPRREEKSVDLLMKYLKNFLLLPVDTLLNALRFPEIGRGSSSWFEASSFFSMYGSIGAFLTAVFGAATYFFPQFTFIQRLLVAGCLLACMGIAASYYIIYKKPSERLPYTVANLNIDAKRGLLPLQHGREVVIEELFGLIGSAKRNNEPAKILIKGASGVGKSSIMQQFARKAVESSDGQFKDVPIYVLNMGDLARNPLFGFVGSVLLEFILLSIGRQEAILVLEEVHAVFTDPSCSLADYIKDRFDRNANVHVIGITTDQEYEEHMAKDGAFTGRFSKVEVRPLDQEETLMVLKRYFEDDPFFCDAADEELYEFIERSKESTRSQPAASLGVCRQMKSFVERMRISTLGKEQLSNKRECLTRKLIDSCNSEEELKITQEIQGINETIKRLTRVQDELRKGFDLLEKIGKIYQTSIAWIRSPKEKDLKMVAMFKRVWKPGIFSMRKRQRNLLKRILGNIENGEFISIDESFSKVLESALTAAQASV